MSDLLDRGYGLNKKVQHFFREWHAIDDRAAENAYVALIPFAAVGLRSIDLERPLDADALKTLLAENVERLEGVAVSMFHKACQRMPGGDAVEGRAVNPRAIALDPDRCEQGGLFAEPGLTLKQAGERAQGIETIWLDEFVRA